MKTMDLTGLTDTIGGAAGLLAAAGATPAHKDDGTPASIPTDMIDPFPHHPYQVRDDQDMERLLDSIRRIGIQSPLLVRPAGNGRWQLISGHRRLHAARLLGHDTVPAITTSLDDDQAILAMVDSNQTTRTHIPLAEQARAMRMRHQATMRQGVRGAGDNRERLAQAEGTSASGIARLVRLGSLDDRLLDRTGTPGGIPKGAALALTNLDPTDQEHLADWLDHNPDARIGTHAAKALANAATNNPLDDDTIARTIADTPTPARKDRTPTLPAGILDALPATITSQGQDQAIAWILDAIHAYANHGTEEPR